MLTWIVLDHPKTNEKYLKALFITDPADDMETIEHSTGRLLEGSGSWLQEEESYLDWLKASASKVIWMHGGPGKGKTMLAISVITSLLDKLPQWPPGTILAYFFCDSTDDRRNSAVQILRSILYQILYQRPELGSYFKEVYEREEEQLFTSRNALQSLWRVLKDIFSGAGVERIYIVIDGLDELNDGEADDLMKLLRPFLDPKPPSPNYPPPVWAERRCAVKWFLTSRNIQSISYYLRKVPNISLECNSKHVQESVWRFIEVRVDELKKAKGYTEKLATSIEDALREKSEGTFLYVSMACRALSQPNVRLVNARSVLAGLPRGLTPLYERIMQQINSNPDPELVGYTKAILRCMVLTLRPLSIQELAIAAELPEDYREDPEMILDYIGLCGSFVTLRQDAVHFIHETVKTYLQPITEVFSFANEDYHADLALSFLRHVNEKRSNELGMVEKTDLLAYPASYWMYHAREAGSHIEWLSLIPNSLFAATSDIREKWLDFYWSLKHPSWDPKPNFFTPLHLSAYAGLSSLTIALLDRGDEINEADANGHTALIWAAKNGYEHVVRLLVERGANVEAKSVDGLTAIMWATIHGHFQVVGTLIEFHANIRVMDRMGWTPLHHAAANGHSNIITSLLAASADIDAKDICQQTALQRAAFCNNLAVIKMLVDQKANINVTDKDGLTLTHLAARDGHIKLLAFWLNLSGDRDAVDDQGWTPLMHAAWFGHTKATKTLIGKGARMEMRSLDGNTALHLATWNGHADVVKALLDSKAAPDVGCDRQETPLQQAAWRGHLAVCQLLLEAGVDPNSKSDTGLTPLHQAAANGHEIIAKLLVEWGGDPNAQDSVQQTPRARALENNHTALARLLKSLEIQSGEEDADADTDVASSSFEEVDPAVCELLGVPLESCLAQPTGKEGFSKTTKVTALVNGKPTHYFMKAGPEADMFRSKLSIS